MLKPNLILIYVQDPLQSAEFYQKLFSTNPVVSLPTYVAFSFENGLTFSLWSKEAKNFSTDGTGHRFELAFMVDDEDAVHELRNLWGELDVAIEQEVYEAVFGPTFVALDPDGHRIRVCLFDK